MSPFPHIGPRNTDDGEDGNNDPPGEAKDCRKDPDIPSDKDNGESMKFGLKGEGNLNVGDNEGDLLAVAAVPVETGGLKDICDSSAFC